MSEKRSTLPQGWEWKKLGDICDFQNGFAFKSNLFKNQGSIIVRISNIQNSVVELKDVAYFDKNDYKNLDAYRVIKGDILIAMSGATTGKIGIYQNDEIAFLNQRVGKFIIVSELLKQYLFYFLTTQIEENLKKSFGAAQPNLSTEQIKNIDIPFPPLEEQRRIVGVLDGLFGKIDKSIALLDESIASASSLMPSALNEVFEELEGKYLKELLGNVDTKMSAGGTPLRSKSEFWNGDIPWFSSGELNQKYTLSSKEYITPLGLKNSSAKLFEKGTLLVGMYDTAAMKMSILHTDGASNQAIVGVKPKENELNIFFLMYQLEYLKPKILEERQGVRQQNLNLSKLKNIQIEYPPLDIQTQTVAYLDALQLKAEALKKAQEKKKEELLALKASLLESAFKGAL